MEFRNSKFITKKRAKKIGRNITQKTFVEIPAQYTPFCKFTKKFRAEVATERAQKLLCSPKEAVENQQIAITPI